MNNRPLFTVLFATRDGDRVLERVLEGYRLASLQVSDWKLVIVDNGSRDGTRRLLESASASLPIQILSVPEPGKNRALNAGIEAVEGTFTIVTDDDSVPSESFLADWRDCVEAQNTFSLFGGSITPLFESTPPHWLMRNGHGLAMLFAERSLATAEVGWDLIYGPNMVVRNDVFEAGFRFDEAVGPDGTKDYAMGSESEFCRRVARDGYRCFFSHKPTVSHIVRTNQLHSAFWRARAFRSGLGRAYMLSTATDRERRLPPFHSSSRVWLKEELRDVAKLLSWDSGIRFDAACARRFRRGFAAGWTRFPKVLIARNGKPVSASDTTGDNQ